MKTAELTQQASAVTDAIFAAFRLHGQLIALGDRMVEEFGLTSARWQVLGSVALADTPMTVPKVARNLGLSRQAVQRVANDLERAGLIYFADNPDHKRAKLIKFTADGENTYRRADEKWAAWANTVFAEFNVAGTEKAMDVMDRVADVSTAYLNANRTEK